MERTGMEGLMPLTEKDVIDILKNREKKLLEIRERRIEAAEAVAETDDLILECSLPGKSGNPAPSGPRRKKDLGDVYEKYLDQLRRRRKDIKSFLWELGCAEEAVDRVWKCYLALPEPEHGIAEKLYAKGRKWDDVRREYGDYTGFVRHRKRALSLILEYYASGRSDSDLQEIRMRLRPEGEKPRPEGRRERKEVPGQLSLPGIL